jgi:IclR family transcriptional regulator, blcABC operon repressor
MTNAKKKFEVPAVARAARLLEALAASGEPVGLAELTSKLGLAKSTVHGLCATLVQAGLVTRLEDGTYHLGLRLVELAHAFLARADLTVEFASVWESMTIPPEESIALSVLDGGEIVYVACRNGTRPFGLNFRIGMRLPANCTASGKALLSTLTPERLEAIAKGGGLAVLTKKSIAKLEPLRRHLALTRKRGYSFDDEETREGLVCFGAPVFGPSSPEAVAAIGMSMPKGALDARLQALAIRTVRDLALALSRRLGASGSWGEERPATRRVAGLR